MLLGKRGILFETVPGVKTGSTGKESGWAGIGKGGMMSPLDHYNNLLYQYIKK